jgi:hypothetical protein
VMLAPAVSALKFGCSSLPPVLFGTRIEILPFGPPFLVLPASIRGVDLRWCSPGTRWRARVRVVPYPSLA